MSLVRWRYLHLFLEADLQLDVFIVVSRAGDSCDTDAARTGARGGDGESSAGGAVSQVGD